MCCTPLSLSIPSVTSPYFGLAFVVSLCRVGAVLPFVIVVLCVFASGALWDLRFLAFSGSAGSPPFSVLCALLVSGAVSVFPCCLLSLVVFPVSVLLASPAPRIVSCVLWSSLHSCVLVPPSEYLVAAVTAPLPCFHAGCMVLLCFPSVIRFMATKAFCPVWGFLPLYTMLLVTSGSLVRPYRGIHRYDDPDTS